MSKLNQELEQLVQKSGGAAGTLSTDQQRLLFSKRVIGDLSNIIYQMNNVYYPLFATLSSTNTLNALDFGLSGNILFTHINATQASSSLFYDNVTGRPRTVKETIDVVLTELQRIENLIGNDTTADEYDDTEVRGLITKNDRNLQQTRKDAFGPNYAFGNDGNADLTYSLSQHIDNLGQFFTDFPSTGNTYTATYPTLSLDINLSDINIDTTLAQSVITGLTADLGYIRTFVGKTTTGAETPTYSAHGTITHVSDGQSLEEAIQTLDAAVPTTVVAHASTHIHGAADPIDADQLSITWTPANYTPTTSPTEVSNTAHLTAHLAGIDAALAAVSLTVSGADNQLVRMDSTTGIQNSLIYLSDTGTIYPDTSGTKNLGATTTTDTRFSNIYLNSGGVLDFNGNGTVRALTGTLSLYAQDDVTIQNGSGKWVGFDSSASALAFDGPGFGGTGTLSSAGSLIVTVAASNDLSITSAGTERFNFDTDNTVLSLITNTSTEPKIQFGSSSSDSYISADIAKNMTISSDGDIYLYPSATEEFIFTGSTLQLPETTSTIRMSSDAEPITFVATGPDLDITGTSDINITTDTGTIQLSANRIDFLNDEDVSHKIRFRCGTNSSAAFINDGGGGDMALTLAGIYTDSRTYVSGDVKNGTRLYLETEIGSNLQQLVFGHDTPTIVMADFDLSATTNPTASQRYCDFKASGTSIGYIGGDGAGNVVYQSFTGGHTALSATQQNFTRGEILCTTGSLGTNNSPLVERTNISNNKKVMGVFTMQIGNEIAYNALGEGSVLVSNVNGDIEAGDLITTSSILGVGQKQDDDIFRSYTVAKCVEDIDWESISPTNGVKIVLAHCTIHCG